MYEEKWLSLYENGLDDPSSNPGLGSLHSTSYKWSLNRHESILSTKLWTNIRAD